MDRELADLHRGAERERRRMVPDPEPCEPGKTLPEQIEGDHAYRDEPPAHEPREPTTTYTISSRYGEHGTGFETTDPRVAEEYSRNGHQVTAETTR